MRPRRRLARCLVTAVLAFGPAATLPRPAMAAGGLVGGGCPAGGVEVDLAGSGDTAVVSGQTAAACRAAPGSRPARGGPRPYWTYEIACSPDHVGSAQGLCSATPCAAGLFFAFRTLHRPDGGTEAAGYSCVSLDRAVAGPGLTAADVFAAVRRVKLPPGSIRTAPSGRGLANLPSRLWLVGDARAPVNLPLGGSTVHAEFRPVQYRWTIGPGRTGTVGAAAWGGAGGSGGGADGSGGDALTVPAMAGSSDRDGEAGIAFRGRGDFVVTVVTTWSATAFLDRRYVGRVGGLESTARIVYPVAELRAALIG